jgi:N6-adenosine-specific RNA methylase IME4
MSISINTCAATIQRQTSTAATVTATGSGNTNSAAPAYALDPCVYDFPPMAHDEFQALKASIQRNGQTTPILVFNNKVVDGRHRLQACAELGIEPRVQKLDVKNYDLALSTAFSLNVNRRSLSIGQLALMAAPLCTRKSGQSKWSAAIEPPLSQEQAAKLFAVSRDSVGRAVRVFVDGSAELKRQVQQGEISLSEAYTEVMGARKFTEPAVLAAAKVVAKHNAQVNERSRTVRLNRQAQLSQQNAALPIGKKYSVLLADPPWDYGMSNERSGSRVLPHNHYPTMSTAAICAMDVKAMVTKDAALYIWCPASLLEDGIAVLQAWGFEYKTCWVWHKTGSKLTCAGGDALAHHELLLVGKRGKGLTIASTKARQSSVFDAPVTKHSAKPAVVHERLERLYPKVVNRIELFARDGRTGWDVWGNQSGKATAADAGGTAAQAVANKQVSKTGNQSVKTLRREGANDVAYRQTA